MTNSLPQPSSKQQVNNQMNKQSGCLQASTLPHALYFADQIKRIEQRAHQDYGIAPSRLMKYAGRAAHEYLYTQWPSTQHSMVFCGAGNNAGDGFVLAALAAQKKQPVSVVLLSDPQHLQGAAKQAYNFAVQENVPFMTLDEAEKQLAIRPHTHTVIVDAILGTGVNRPVTDAYLQAINLINQSGYTVLGVDIPSGIQADTGYKMGRAVICSATITFVGLKLGLFTANAPAYTGKVVFDRLDLPAELFSFSAEYVDECVNKPTRQIATQPLINSTEAPPLTETPQAQRVDEQQLNSHAFFTTSRQGDAHKGAFGHVLVIGGDNAMGGAAILASESALDAGAGRVSCATQPQHIAPLLARAPEIMAAGVRNGQDLPFLWQPHSVLCIGPGLGQSPWSEQLLQAATLTQNTLVMDADALNLLAVGRVIRQPKRDNWVLTPHPGEAARLLKCSIEHIQQNRLHAAKQLQAKYGGVVVLKGAGTVITNGAQHYIANVGTPAMAVAGMGDVLAGVIAALLAQGVSLTDAALLGVCAHGYAGTLAAMAQGERGLRASTLLTYLHKAMAYDHA